MANDNNIKSNASKPQQQSPATIHNIPILSNPPPTTPKTRTHKSPPHETIANQSSSSHRKKRPSAKPYRHVPKTAGVDFTRTTAATTATTLREPSRSCKCTRADEVGGTRVTVAVMPPLPTISPTLPAAGVKAKGNREGEKVSVNGGSSSREDGQEKRKKRTVHCDVILHECTGKEEEARFKPSILQNNHNPPAAPPSSRSKSKSHPTNSLRVANVNLNPPTLHTKRLSTAFQQFTCRGNNDHLTKLYPGNNENTTSSSFSSPFTTSPNNSHFSTFSRTKTKKIPHDRRRPDWTQSDETQLKPHLSSSSPVTHFRLWNHRGSGGDSCSSSNSFTTATTMDIIPPLSPFCSSSSPSPSPSSSSEEKTPGFLWRVLRSILVMPPAEEAQKGGRSEK